MSDDDKHLDPTTLVGAPLLLSAGETVAWDDEADVVVVGFGGAGAVAAIQARECGASVLIVDRFDGGGATVLSGGVIYAGGTDVQRAAGFEDSADTMYRYLKLEVGDAVSDRILRDYCEGSQAELDWLRAHGLKFNDTFEDGRVAFPAEQTFLYYSGNEKLYAARADAPPVPRGVRTVGKGLGGQHFYKGLSTAALQLGARYRPHAPASRLVVDAEGGVVGVEVLDLTAAPSALKRHRALKKRYDMALRFIGGKMAAKAARRLVDLERDFGVPRLIRARKGTILAAGGFMFNPDMVQRHAPRYTTALPLGTVSCNGSGIQLGLSVGGEAARMDSVAAWRHLSMPVAPAELPQGLIIGPSGRRFVAEDAYSATVGGAIAETQDGRAWLIMDAALRKKAFRAIRAKRGLALLMQIPTILTLLLRSTKAANIEALGTALGVDPAELARTVAENNNAVRAGAPDPLGKCDPYRHILDRAPFYAVDISTGSTFSQAVTITLGGLVVDEGTGLVKGSDGRTINGLYAVGRTAVGIASNSYVSGLSIGDCVYSGRRAGRHAAGQDGRQADAASLQSEKA